MRKPVPRRVWCAVAGAILLAGGLVLARRDAWVDFSDSPALLVEVSQAGTVTLDTYQGRIVAPLAGVNWKTDFRLSAAAQGLVREAQREKVAFKKVESGHLQIWYDTGSGPVSLNEKLIDLLASESAPNPR